MYATAFQGGSCVEIFSAGGSKPASDWKIQGAKKEFDKSVKGYVYAIDGGVMAKMQLPKEEKKQLGLVQHYLVLQVFLPLGQPISFEFGVTDQNKNKRRLFLSSSFKESVVNPLHARLPLIVPHRGVWLNLTFDLPDLLAGCFRGCIYRSLDVLVVGPCRLRRIFTMKNPPAENYGASVCVWRVHAVHAPCMRCVLHACACPCMRPCMRVPACVGGCMGAWVRARARACA